MATSKITNYDSTKSTITTNGPEIDTQAISYLEYDRYGNALHQTILTTAASDGQKTFKDIVNTYDNKKAQMKGNATTSTTMKYSGDTADGAKLIEKTFTTTELYDNKGNAIDQKTETFVRDAQGNMLPQKIITTHNESIDARGDAHIQKITTSETDENGKDPQVTSYQVIENRLFDINHNAENQRIITYSDDSATKVLKDIQEIRATAGFTYSGTANVQFIVTYAALAMTASDFIEAKMITNNNVDSQGNVGKSTIVRYGSATIADNLEGTITVVSISAVDRQTITTAPTSFDNRGNAKEQKMVNETYQAAISDFVFGSAQIVTNNSFNIHDRAESSRIKNYSDVACTNFVDMQDVVYQYDRSGNTIHQDIVRYADKDSIRTIEKKAIENIYQKGSIEASQSTIIVKNADGVIVEQQRINYTKYDIYGNSTSQEIARYGYDADGKEILLDFKISENTYTSDIGRLKGLADSAKIWTYDKRDGTCIESQEVVYRAYDVSGNVTKQEVTRYADKEMTTILDYKEIANTYDDQSGIWRSKGWANTSTILTYTDRGGIFVSGQQVTYTRYSDWGNAELQTVKKYGTYDASTKTLGNLIDKKIIENTYSDENLSRIGRSIVTLYSAENEFVEKQDVSYASYDDWGNVLSQSMIRKDINDKVLDVKDTINTYVGINVNRGWISNASVTTKTAVDGEVTENQVVNYTKYDNWGNALKQDITRKTGADSAAQVLDIKYLTSVYSGVNALKAQADSTDICRRAPDGTTFVDRQFVIYQEYDFWGNATSQNITKYAKEGEVTADDIIDYKEIQNEYSLTGHNRGLASKSDVTTYDKADLLTRTFEEHQFVETSSYDNWGNALHQTVTAMNKDKVVLSVKDINTEYLDVLRGLAKTTNVVTYDKIATDSTRVVTEHQVVTVDSKVDYDDWGNATLQTVKAYANATLDTLISVKTITTTYTGVNALKSLAATTDVVTTAANGAFEEHQFVTATNYDAWGNAKNQNVKAYSNPDKAMLKDNLISIKDIETIYLDSIRGLAGTTNVTTRAADGTTFEEHQIVEASNYDAWGNAADQTVTAKDQRMG
ncbi:MAG: hypothetical protein NTY76_05720 [Candidatus Omnitrophica bacterium]|nr:hypothetical protein [Candidatus Omnitrophota bacterium]